MTTPPPSWATPPQPQPQRRRPRWAPALIALGTATALAIGGILVWDWAHETQDEIADQCLPALRDRPPGDTSRPDACDGLSDENYTMLLISVGLNE